jgi:hypothetical protein
MIKGNTCIVKCLSDSGTLQDKKSVCSSTTLPEWKTLLSKGILEHLHKTIGNLFSSFNND